MPDTTNDIDADIASLRHHLCCGVNPIASESIDRFIAALTALIKERDALLKSLERMQSRAESCEARFESLHLDEIDWKKERKQLRADLKAARKELDAMRKGVARE